MNEVLREELLALRAADDAMSEGAPPFPDVPPALRALRDRNADRLAEIVRGKDWPKLSEVGPDGAEAAWLIAMHALGRREFMLAWAWDMAKSAQQGEARPQDVATLTDLTRVLRGKDQIYGSQVDWDEEGRLSPLPITQPETVDVRRESVHLEPLDAWLADVRARAEAAGERPPPDPAARRRRVDAFLAETGWRKG